MNSIGSSLLTLALSSLSRLIPRLTCRFLFLCYWRPGSWACWVNWCFSKTTEAPGLFRQDFFQFFKERLKRFRYTLYVKMRPNKCGIKGCWRWTRPYGELCLCALNLRRCSGYLRAALSFLAGLGRTLKCRNRPGPITTALLFLETEQLRRWDLA